MQERKERQFIKKLTAKKEELIKNIQSIEDNGLRSSISNTTGELSSYDNHPADLGSETFERAKDVGLKDNERVLLDSVERALQKIADGTYGQCESCGREIAEERLEALPWATECIDCSRKMGRAKGRPLEEASLEPPFRRSFQGNKDEIMYREGKFAEEDALDLVTQYGSSDTIQDMPGTQNYEDVIP